LIFSSAKDAKKREVKPKPFLIFFTPLRVLYALWVFADKRF